MSKLKLLEHTYTKLIADKSFVAYYLEQLAIKDNKSREEIIILLNCSTEGYFKLGLCQVPDVHAIDFDSRIKKIADYVNVSDIILSNIILFSVETKKEKVAINNKLLNDFKNLISLPAWFLRWQGKIYQGAFSVIAIILLVISFTPQKPYVKSTQAFMSNYESYTDSRKYTQLPDNTFVNKNNL